MISPHSLSSLETKTISSSCDSEYLPFHHLSTIKKLSVGGQWTFTFWPELHLNQIYRLYESRYIKEINRSYLEIRYSKNTTVVEASNIRYLKLCACQSLLNWSLSLLLLFICAYPLSCWSVVPFLFAFSQHVNGNDPLRPSRDLDMIDVVAGAR